MIKHPFLLHAWLTTALAAAFCPLSASAQAVDYSFQFPTGSNPPFALQNTGKWSQAEQWTGGQLPGSADVLQVTLPQTYQYVDGNNQTITNTLNSALLNHDSGDDVISAISPDNKADLRLTGGTLTLQNSSILNAGLIVNGGQLAGNGNLTVNGAAILDSGTMSGAGATTLNGSSTVLYGLGLEAGRVLENKGNLNFQYDYNSIYSNDNTGRFDNSGTVSKSGGAVISTIGTQFNNSGIVNVQTGILRLTGGGTQSGSFGGPGVVEFNTGTHNLQSGVNFNNINVSGTLNSPSVDYSIDGTSTYYGARMSGAGTTTLKGPANDNYGLDLTENRVLELSKGNTFDFQLPSSNVSSSDNTGTFNNLGTVTKSSSSGASGINAVFNNSGSVVVAQGGSIRLSGGGTHSGSFGGEGVVDFYSGIHNLMPGVTLNNIGLGGTLNSPLMNYSIDGTSSYSGGVMSGAGTTTLKGTAIDYYGLDLKGGRVLELSKGNTFDFNYASSGVTSSDQTGTFNNLGTVTKSVGEGVSRITAVFNNNGAVDVAQGGVLQLSGGGTHSGSFSGEGVTEFTGGTHTLLTGVSFSNIILGAGSLDSAVNYSVAGTASFYGGKLSGIGRTILNGASWVEYSFALDPGRVLENHNVLDFKRDNSSIYGEGAIDNIGTVRKSIGTGASTISTQFSNSGIVDVQSGTLRFEGLAANFTNNSIVHTDAGTVLLASSIENTSNGIISGTGTVALNGGTMTNAGQINPGNSPGTLTVDGNLVLTSTSNLNIEIAGLNDFDKLIVTGQAILGGSLNLYAVNGYRPNLGDSYDFLWLNSVSGSFDRVNLFGFDSGVSAGWAVNGGSLQLSFIVSPNNNPQVPEPSTIWLLIGGWGAWLTSRRGLLKSINSTQPH